jgi:flagellar hook assembly protein FlgD
LKQNYPNPFNATTTIRYSTYSARSAHTTLEIYNILGHKLRTLVDEPQGRGNHEVIWDGKDAKGREVASGIYLYQLKLGDFIQTKKMLLLK